MRRVITATLLATIFTCFAQAQLLTRGVGSGGTGGAAATYQGPGDIISGALAWWGLRCYNAAYAGNVADVWDGATGSTTETLLTCSAGGTINETINPLSTTCAVSCKIKTLYDQSGALSCTGSTACDLAQATNANRPAYTQNCTGLGAGKPCATFVAASTQSLRKTTNIFTQAQPLSQSTIAQRTGSTTSFNTVCGSSGSALEFNSTANRLGAFFGAHVSAVANDNTWHAEQLLVNGASSSLMIDGSSSSVNPGTNTVSGNLQVGVNGVNAVPLDGTFTECGMWAGDKSASFGALNTNQHSYWGF